MVELTHTCSRDGLRYFDHRNITVRYIGNIATPFVERDIDTKARTIVTAVNETTNYTIPYNRAWYSLR